MKRNNLQELVPQSSADALPSTVLRTRVRPRIPLADLEYTLVKPRGPWDSLLQLTYETWRNAWNETLRELHAAEHVDSNEFTRQDEMGVLLCGGRCVSVTGLRWLELSRPTARDDSYFKHWPEAALCALGERSITISSNTTIAREWRGAVIEGSEGEGALTLKEATIALSLYRFVTSAASDFVGVARNDKSMNRVASSLGGKVIGEMPVHGIDSDIMRWEREDVGDLGPIVNQLWRSWRGQ